MDKPPTRTYVYEYHFLDQTIENFYKQEDQLSQFYKIFAGIAIFISCLGLYGLVSFMAVQRTKEIGIRKVLGASVRTYYLSLVEGIYAADHPGLYDLRTDRLVYHA